MGKPGKGAVETFTARTQPFWRETLRPQFVEVDLDTGLLKLVGERANQFAAPADELDLSACDRRGQHVGAEFDPVGDHRVRRPLQALNAFDLDRFRTFAGDLGAHPAQALGEIDDLRFAGSVPEYGSPTGEGRRHQHVFGGADGDHRELEDCAFQSVRGGSVDVAVAEIERRAERLKAAQVEIDRAGANGATAWQRNDGVAIASEHRAEDEDRGAHLANNLVVGTVIGDRLGADHEDTALL